ncbi:MULTISPECIES: hypothetical protein [Vibrio]|uniref:hypothetical protein n=1 Tax=Vibrio TaxID=662 RepID=UPI0002EF3980|nr:MULTISPECIES: hypothetical protein [Vibrio]CAK4069691.1 hypothetical protein VDT1_1945 [Vibrio sp. 16]
MVRFFAFLLLVNTSLAWAQQDPTAPLNWQKPKVAQPAKKPVSYRLPKLQSIVCVADVPCKAILNGEVVMAGERVSGYYVNNIESERVVLSRKGKQWTLELFSLDIKQ